MSRLGIKQCPICCNKLYSSLLLLEHLKLKHPKNRIFKCNVCMKKSLRGAAAFVNHIDLCHDSCNVTAEDERQLPFVKTASKTANSATCNQIQLLICERHGEAFPTNCLADKHRIQHGSAFRPCFMIKMQGIVGSSEEILLSPANEEHNKIRLDSYKKPGCEKNNESEPNHPSSEKGHPPANGTQPATQTIYNYPGAWNYDSRKKDWGVNSGGISTWRPSPSVFGDRDGMFASYMNPCYAEPQTPYSLPSTSEPNRYNNN